MCDVNGPFKLCTCSEKIDKNKPYWVLKSNRKDEEECENDCWITCIAISPGARKLTNGTPKISSLFPPIAKESTERNNSEDTRGENIV